MKIARERALLHVQLMWGSGTVGIVATFIALTCLARWALPRVKEKRKERHSSRGSHGREGEPIYARFIRQPSRVLFGLPATEPGSRGSDGGDAAPASRVPKPLALSSIEEIV